LITKERFSIDPERTFDGGFFLKMVKTCWVSDLVLDTDLHKTRELEILKALATKGHTTALIATTSRRYFKLNDPRVKAIFIPIRRAPLISHVLYTVFLFFFLPIYVLVEKPDYVIMDPSISVIGSIPCLLLSRFLNIKFVLDIKSTPVEVKGFSAKLAELWFIISVLIAKKLFHGVEAVTPLMKEEICLRFNLAKQTVGVWTNGVPTDLFNPRLYSAESALLRERFKLTGRFVIFYHGVFSASRGLTETVKAIQILKQKHPDFVLFLLGSGELASSLGDLIRRESLQDNVIIHRPVPYEDVPMFIALSDVCIVPLPNIAYWKSQSPLKLMEYLSMGKTVLLTDIPAHKAVAGNEKCCIYLRTVNPLEIAENMVYAYSHKIDLPEWGKNGRKIVERLYTWNKVANEVENYFSQISFKAVDKAI
jgi:glycosyltransferase involved in cell wall biosynthesis